MNSGKAGDSFRRQKSNFDISATISQLQEAIAAKQDMVEALKTISGIQTVSMPKILKCTPDVYDAHLNHLDAVTPYSPLTGNHVLNLCKHTKVHPADLVSKSPSIFDACPPHIYKALRLLAEEKDSYSYDRHKAFDALDVEEERYNMLIQRNPAIAHLFDRISNSANNQSMRAKVDIKNKDLKSVFKSVNEGLDGQDPESHIENFHTSLPAEIKSLNETMDKRRVQDSEAVIDLRKKISSLYGDEKVEEIFSNVMERTHLVFADPGIAGKPEGMTDEEIKSDIKDHLPPHDDEKSTNMLSDSIYAIATRLEATREISNLVKIKQMDLSFLEVLSSPESFYAQYLYSNHVVSKRPYNKGNDITPPSNDR